ncbi:MAG: hypothetical protein NTW87_17925 [Planctomycetota bacterium]|nr:hypothetical protein [Planctomycetota bacterium]
MLCFNIHVTLCTLACAALVSLALGAADLPAGSAPKPLDFPHFPDRMHAFTWRNWSLVDPARLAKVLETSADNVLAVAESMGLPAARPVPPEQDARGYITVIRRNWHLLPYDQLLVLLGMSADQLAYTLREDDFLFIKLGLLKPACAPLRYTPPTDEARKRAAEIKRLVQETFGNELQEPGEPRFGFIQQFMQPAQPARPADKRDGTPAGLRYIYSYCALYGDALANPNLDPYPDGLLERLADLGVNGIWMHTVLHTLAPSPAFPELGAGHEVRLASLRKLVERARRHNIAIYLYMNEPRAMPAAFFKDRADIKGVQEGDHFAMCTSSPAVREWLSGMLAHVFTNVPGLGGVFTITASENFTNCASHGRQKDCPRCSKRTPAEIIAEVNAAIEAGVHRGNADAKVIAWDWGWGGYAADVIAKLPKSIWFMSVSEWDKPIERGGVKTTVGEYSISAVGPGPRATRHWALARQAGLKTVAKMQVNNTWELSAVPYLPVLDLIAEHCQGLAATGVDGVMLSWSLGGYPSPNLEVVRAFGQDPRARADTVLDAIARERFGAEGAPNARKAWTAFSNAFREFPYHVGVLYNAPMQYGPANLLFAAPTGYHATMVGFPYDDLNTWRGPYPATVFADQFAKVASGWQEGIPFLQRAAEQAPPDRAADAQSELRFAEAAQLHFRSVANQARFVIARDALRGKGQPPDAGQRKERTEEMRRALQDELQTARRLFTLARLDSRIGYEASNHYYYVPHDLVEKVINCRCILDALRVTE